MRDSLFKTVKGFAIHFVFAIKEELSGWPKKEFPDEEDLKQKAAEMESPTIGVNFTFLNSKRPPDSSKRPPDSL